jgi:3-oxoacyl-[acyl-carrier-protein] synthase-1
MTTDGGRSGRGVAILGVGAQTSIGRSAPATAASVRAGVANFAEHPFLLDQGGEPMVVARARWLDTVDGAERFVELAAAAASEAIGPELAGPGIEAARLSVFVGLPAPRPGLPEGLTERLQERFREPLGPGVLAGEVATFPHGHAAGLIALETGWRAIDAGSADACLVGGVDSYLAPETLTWLDAGNQLHSPRNSWGFVPGEAAGFCLLVSGRLAAGRHWDPLGTVVGAATARETKLIKTKTVCIGEGLTEAFHRTLAALPAPEAKVDGVIGDLNGEPYRADEFAFAMIRSARQFRDPGRFLTPADCWGDVGAASGPLFVALAVAAGRGGSAAGPYTLVWTSSEGGERATALLHVEPQLGEDLA